MLYLLGKDVIVRIYFIFFLRYISIFYIFNNFSIILKSNGIVVVLERFEWSFFKVKLKFSLWYNFFFLVVKGYVFFNGKNVNI